jgi:Putative phage tail protein
MAAVLVLLNPLDTSQRRRLVVGAGVALLDWLDEVEPAAGRLERRVYVNESLCTDRAYRSREHDEVLVAFAPGTATVGAYVAQAIVAFIIGVALNQLFGPKMPKAGTLPSPSQVYGIAPPKNQSRLGQPIPVVYGSVVSLPDFAAQPYVFYNQNDQWLHALLCVGLGDHDVTEILFADSSGAPLGSDVVQWRAFRPSDHGSRFGVIQGQTGVRENVVTSPAVGTQELLGQRESGVWVPSTWYWALSNQSFASAPSGVNLVGATMPDQKMALLPPSPTLGTTVACTLYFDGAVYTLGTYTATSYTPVQTPPPGALIPAATFNTSPGLKWVGPFECCKAGQTGTSLEFDFIYPQGLWGTAGDGSIAAASSILRLVWEKIDPSGNVIAGGGTVDITFTASNTTPQRFTTVQPVASGRYRAKCAQVTNGQGYAPSGRVGMQCIWQGLKIQLDPLPASQRVYGNVTLIAVQLKASNGIAEDAAASMRFRVTRRLAPLGSGTPAPTQNPADAFVDIVTAPYGGNRPLNADELDLTELTSSRTAWAGANGFNAVFDQPSTVWEALGLAVQCVNAAPLPIGSRMSLIHDGVQPVRAALFTDANIAAGSLAVTENFDETGTPVGVRVTYRDPLTFAEATVSQPVDAPDYTAINLFGCTDATVAAQMATLAQNKRQLQRSSVTFSTELEGLSCLPGDRIGIAAGMVKWAQGARVTLAAGLVLTLDTALVWTAGATHAVQLRDPTGVPARLVGVTPGAGANQLVLPSAPPFAIVDFTGSMEPTTLSFGVVDAEVSDWSVTKMTPNGATVTIDALNYDADIYAGAAVFTRELAWEGAA